MTKTSEEALIAILIEKLGGKVTITHEDFARADELEITRWDRPDTLDYKLTAERPPEILVGEIVTAEPQSIEPPKGHHHESWQLRRTNRGALYCAACGATVKDPA
jgi:hypothetical protein